MGRDFRPVPRGGAGMGLHFLDPPRPILAPPRINKGEIVILSYPKTLLFKQKYHQLILFYLT